jgi:hypothetical protein
MPLKAFDAPGNLTDLSEAGRARWHEFIFDITEAVIEGDPSRTNDSPRAQYYNLAKVETDDDAVFRTVSWTAFPRQVEMREVSQVRRWALADSARDRQDEYCEWSVHRNAEHKITRVDFTCESPEYWDHLARDDRQTVVDLYREHVDPLVAEEDLFDQQGRYVRRNRWNTDTCNGAMHLVQEDNTLVAEIGLCAAASIVRSIDGVLLDDEQKLIRCGDYGQRQRNSDPHIGGVINAVARLKADLALANPVGLYFDDLSAAGWAAPDGADPKTFWRYVRGDADHPVRAVYEVPADAGYVVGDITILGQKIGSGSQIAEYISIKATAVACRIGRSTVQPFTACVGKAAPVRQRSVSPGPIRTLTSRRS